MKTETIIMACQLLDAAKLDGMSGAGKIAIVKTLKVLKPIADEFEAFRDSSAEKLKSENHDAMIELARKWQEDEKAITDKEKGEVNCYFESYNKLFMECINEDLQKEHDVENSIRKISEADFEKLVGNNDWNTRQIILMETVLNN